MDFIGWFIAGFGLFAFLLVFVLGFFGLWMFIHAVIRTIKMWPAENVVNILMILLMCALPFIGAIVYYFVCYRASHVLTHQ
ncbi:MAG: hypothetical protein Q7R73_00730 [bacterium]|nr:hypothetical protein [bacterium]